MYGLIALSATIGGRTTYCRYMETIDMLDTYKNIDKYVAKFTMYCDKIGIRMAIEDFEKGNYKVETDQRKIEKRRKKLEKIERLASPYF